MTDPADRLKKIRDDMAVKSRLLMERHIRTDGNGRISNQGAEEALIAAGMKEPPTPANTVTDLKIARLEAGIEHGLNSAQVEALTGTTPEQIAEQAAALAPPGDGGPRGSAPDPGDALDQQIREAEQAGDIRQSMSLKTQKLAQISQAKAERNHPNNR